MCKTLRKRWPKRWVSVNVLPQFTASMSRSLSRSLVRNGPEVPKPAAATSRPMSRSCVLSSIAFAASAAPKSSAITRHPTSWSRASCSANAASTVSRRATSTRWIPWRARAIANSRPRALAGASDERPRAVTFPSTVRCGVATGLMADGLHVHFFNSMLMRVVSPASTLNAASANFGARSVGVRCARHPRLLSAYQQNSYRRSCFRSYRATPPPRTCQAKAFRNGR